MSLKAAIINRTDNKIIIVGDIDSWDVEHNYDWDYEKYFQAKLDWFNPKKMDFLVGITGIEFQSCS